MRAVQRSRRALDWALVLVLGAAWLAALAYGVRDGIQTQHGWVPGSASPPARPSSGASAPRTA